MLDGMTNIIRVLWSYTIVINQGGSVRICHTIKLTQPIKTIFNKYFVLLTQQKVCYKLLYKKHLDFIDFNSTETSEFQKLHC